MNKPASQRVFTGTVLQVEKPFRIPRGLLHIIKLASQTVLKAQSTRLKHYPEYREAY
jgi:hypothetical protein